MIVTFCSAKVASKAYFRGAKGDDDIETASVGWAPVKSMLLSAR